MGAVLLAAHCGSPGRPSAMIKVVVAPDQELVRARRVLARLRGTAVARAAAGRIRRLLPPRELDVLRLMAHGDTNSEIAGALLLGERTVKTHVASIFAKLEARDRAAAIVLARAAGV